MSDNIDKDVIDVSDGKEGKFARMLTSEEPLTYKLSGMYREWFLDYASYVILERAVPHLTDGLKPVQRRLLHSLKRMDDGRYNKVANVIGHTMQFHPHGDASIGDALVGLGQKDLLVDCQGNWGNILTGDEAAAPRYIEARLSKLALDVIFNPKTTEWMSTYDGRNKEPVTLPVKFPLLLAQGAEGIAVGLASRILPHNVLELLEASIKHLKSEEFEIFPDFPTGGYIDCSRYNDGLRGGAVRVRAKIVKTDRRTLTITELPFGKTTSSLIESILRANERGQIKIRKVDDNTSADVEIIVHLTNDVSPDQTIDALYAFTDCETSISPNSCVIYDNRPVFMGVSDILRTSADNTRDLLRRELEIELDELNESWHMSSLERIFIENRIYHDIEECTTWEGVLETIDKGLEPHKPKLKRDVTQEDIIKLTEIRIKRISRYDAFRADEVIKDLEDKIKQAEKNLNNLTQYAIAFYEDIIKRYGKGRERRTEIRNFDTIEAAKVVIDNAKLYVDRVEGFYGIGNQMRREEFVTDCSDIDDVIVISRDGKYTISKVEDKSFFRKDIIHIDVFKRNDERTVYNVIYRDGRRGPIMMKRCFITSTSRDKEYDLTKGTPHSEILYMSVNPNGEAETLKIYFKPRPRLRNLVEELDFSQLAIRGRGTQGNIFTRNAIHKIVVEDAGVSTLDPIKVWFDPYIRRLNTEERGELMGQFEGDDRLIVFTKSTYYTTNFDVGQHFPEDLLLIEKWDKKRVYSVVYHNTELDLTYVKRFTAEITDKNPQEYLDKEDKFIAMNSDDYPALEVYYGGERKTRPMDMIDVDEFIGIKSHRAKGKRLTNLEVDKVVFVEPIAKTLTQPDSDTEQSEIPHAVVSEETPVNPDKAEIQAENSVEDSGTETIKKEEKLSENVVQMDLFGN